MRIGRWILLGGTAAVGTLAWWRVRTHADLDTLIRVRWALRRLEAELDHIGDLDDE